jgi:hypothetical protein
MTTTLRFSLTPNICGEKENSGYIFYYRATFYTVPNASLTGFINFTLNFKNYGTST